MELIGEMSEDVKAGKLLALLLEDGNRGNRCYQDGRGGAIGRVELLDGGSAAKLLVSFLEGGSRVEWCQDGWG